MESNPDQEELAPMPQLDDEDIGYDQSKYQAKLAEWMHNQSVRATQAAELQRQQAIQQRSQEELNRQTMEQHQLREESFSIDHPDYRQVISDPSFVQAKHVAQAAVMSENGPALGYHLAKNPEIAAELNALPPMIGFAETWHLAKTLNTPAPVTQSQAPEPSAPVQPQGKIQKDPSDMSMDEYAKSRGYDYRKNKPR